MYSFYPGSAREETILFNDVILIIIFASHFQALTSSNEVHLSRSCVTIHHFLSQHSLVSFLRQRNHGPHLQFVPVSCARHIVLAILLVFSYWMPRAFYSGQIHIVINL